MAVKILVPIDGSEQSWAALEHACTVFADADVTALHVIDPMETHYGEGQLIHTPEEYERMEADARELLDRAERRAEEEGVELSTALGTSRRPAREIVDYVEAHDVDHVVMGSHGRSGISRVLLGSVAEAVVRRSPAPVTVIRTMPDVPSEDRER